MKIIDIYNAGRLSSSLIVMSLIKNEKDIESKLHNEYSKEYGDPTKEESLKLTAIANYLVNSKTSIYIKEIEKDIIDIDLNNKAIRITMLAIFSESLILSILRLIRFASKDKIDFINTVQYLDEHNLFDRCSVNTTINESIDKLSYSSTHYVNNTILDRLIENDFLELHYDFNHKHMETKNELYDDMRRIAIDMVMELPLEINNTEVKSILEDIKNISIFLSYKPMLEYDKELFKYSYIIFSLYKYISAWKYCLPDELRAFTHYVLDNYSVTKVSKDKLLETIPCITNPWLEGDHIESLIIRSLTTNTMFYDLLKVEYYKSITNNRDLSDEDILNYICTKVTENSMSNFISDYDILFNPVNSFRILSSSEHNRNIIIKQTINKFKSKLENNDISKTMNHLSYYLKSTCHEDQCPLITSNFRLDQLLYTMTILNRTDISVYK